MQRQPSIRNRCFPGCLKPSPRSAGKHVTEILTVWDSDRNQYTRKLRSPGTTQPSGDKPGTAKQLPGCTRLAGKLITPGHATHVTSG
jgi:hypothetical protein